jgi:tetratricopeptide (TPR) repeat protein
MAGAGAIVVIALLVVSWRVIVSSRGDDEAADGDTAASVVSDTSTFAARFEAAAAMRARGDYGEALTTLRAIRTEANNAGDEPAWGEAQWRVAEIHREVGNATSGALAYGYFFNTFRDIEPFADSPRIPESLYWAAYFKETQEKEDYPTAIALYNRLVGEYPQHARVGSALFRAAYLMDEKQRPPRGVDDAAYYGRAARFYRLVIDEHTGSEDREQAFYRLGKMYEDHKQIRDYERALRTYEEMAEAYPESSYDPLFLAAKVADRKLDDDPRAIRLYEAFLLARPSSEHADDARSRLRRLR